MFSRQAWMWQQHGYHTTVVQEGLTEGQVRGVWPTGIKEDKHSPPVQGS